MNQRRRAERSARRQVIIGAVCLVVTLLVGIAVIWLSGGVARAHGGGIESTARRTGTADAVACEVSATSLNGDWICTSDRIEWTSTGSIPPGVSQQHPPYEILSSTDVSGHQVNVSSHLPMGWQTAGSGRRSGYPVEIIVAQGHPVGSQTWWAVQVWAPVIMIGMAVAAALFAGSAWYRLRRRLRRRK